MKKRTVYHEPCTSQFTHVSPFPGHVHTGDGWSARAEDAVLHGCIPLVIMDGVHAVFEGILDWDSFSIRIKQVPLL